MVSVATPRGAMPPPPTPLPKRSTLGLKRDSSYLDTDDASSLSNTTKKLKVAFDPNVDVRIVDDWTEKSFDLVKEEVRLGVERHLAAGDQRDDSQYIKLLQTLSQDAGSGEAPSGKLLKKYILAIDAKVSSLGECGKLAAAVLDLSWVGRDEVFAGLYIRFLTSLATAHSKFIPSIMQSLVAHFARLPASSGRLAGENPVDRATMFTRVHMAIRILLRQVPSASAALARAMKGEFPNDLATTRSYVQYQKHLLRCADYAPELKAEILSVITQRLVNIDVQIQLDIEDLEEEAEERLLQQQTGHKGQPAEAEDSDDSDIDSVSESEETVTEDEQRLREVRLKVAKMDGTLDMLFEYYTPLIQNGPRAELNDAYQQLLSHFATFILPNRTRHAQFLVFHFSQTLPQHTTLFAQQCLSIAFQPSASTSIRLHACAYLASFVARGAHLSSASVRDVFAILCEHLEGFRRRYEPSCRGPDKRTYCLYYAVAQAILYIFCFRWRDLVVGSASPEPGDEDLSEDDLLAEGRDLAWLPGVKEALQKNIHSRLNPLKVCSPAIVGEFAKIAHHIRFLYIFSILETNKRVRLGNGYTYYTTGGMMDMGRRETAMDRKVGEAHLQLEAYFPFDPYHLPKSKRWVDGDYNEWKQPAGMKQDDDDDSDDDEEDDSEDESLPEELDQLPGGDTESTSS
ncbi:RNA polymerase I-specific transcription initiation factor RRN3 [Hortaea werneckii]|nr:RNA polymerase I-specific transcription initiation factor RRN3 [Hortaea werneckii]